MAQSTAEMLQNALKSFESSTPDIEATAVISSDGLVMASRLPADVEEDRIGAMSAALLSLGDRTVSELDKGEIQQVIVKGSAGYTVLMKVGQDADAVLGCMTNEKVKLGLLFLEMKRAADTIGQYI